MMTPEEIRAIISETLREGSGIRWWSYVVVAIVVFIASFLGGYLRRKGENVATKEDVKRITDEIESVRHEYAKELHIHQVRYEKEFGILSSLSEKLVSLRDAALSLRPIADLPPPEGKEEEWKRKRLERFRDAARDMYIYCETKKAFFPEKIHDSLAKLGNVAWKEATQYSLWTPDPEDRRHFDSEYWEKAEQNAEKISQISDEVMEEIRKRIKKWETLDWDK